MRNILVGALLSAWIVLPGCAAEPARPDPRAEISGRVVDAETGRPIEGAAVVATWRTEVPPSPAAIAFGLAIGGHGGSEERFVQIKEALTNAEGRFTIPAWSASEQLHVGSIVNRSPEFSFFKPGYEPAYFNRHGWERGSYDGEPGLRGQPRELALYRYGMTPKQDPGFSEPGRKVPPPDEAILRSVAGFRDDLERNVQWADDRNAPRDSRARQEVRKSQQRAAEMVARELQRLQSEYSKKKAQQGKDKQ